MHRAFLATCAFFLLIAAPVSAELRAEDVWNDWQSFAVRNNIRLSTDALSATEAGLTIRGLHLAWTGLGHVEIDVHVPEVRLEPRGDGIEIIAPAPTTIETRLSGAAGRSLHSTSTLTYSNRKLRATGTLNEIAYTFSFRQLDILTETESNVAASPQKSLTEQRLVRGKGVLSHLPGNTQQPAKARFELASHTMINQSGPLPVMAETEGGLRGLQLTATVVPPDRPGMLPGLHLDAHVASSFQTNALSAPQGGFSFHVSNGPQDLDITLQQGRLRLDRLIQEAATRVSITSLPLSPIAFSARNLTARLDLPLHVDGGVHGFALDLSLTDITLSDEQWHSFDPDGQIDHAPGDFTLAVSGATNGLQWPNGLFRSRDRDAATAGLSIDDLRLDFGGALLQASGSIDLVPGATTQSPQARGRLSLSLDNGTALLNAMTATGGLGLALEEFSGLQRLLGLFTRLSEKDDRLISEIDLNPGSGLAINGVRLR